MRDKLNYMVQDMNNPPMIVSEAEQIVEHETIRLQMMDGKDNQLWWEAVADVFCRCSAGSGMHKTLWNETLAEARALLAKKV